jgi:hypothetical protein
MGGMTAADEKAKDGAVGQDDRDPGPAAQVAAAEPRSAPDAGEERGDLAVEAYARDHEGLSDEDERDALDFLLAPKPPRIYGVKVKYDTEAGIRPLTFVVRASDGRKIDGIEQANVSEATGKIDRITADCQIVALACVALESASGRAVELTSAEFLTVRVPKRDDSSGEPTGEMVETRLASPADALEARFKTQLGIVSGVAREVRRISGYDPERVGVAQRRLVDAAGNS